MTLQAATEGEILSLNWFNYHRRSDELGQALSAQVVFLPNSHLRWPIRYFVQWRDSRRQFKKISAKGLSAVLVMQPPALSLACAVMSRRLRHAVIVGDLHTGAFSNPKWSWSLPLVLYALRKRGFAVVPNDELADICRSKGVDVIVSHCIIPDEEMPKDATRLATDSDDAKHVLVPLSYSQDEPVDEVLGAARMLPSVHFTLTGNAPAAVKTSSPKNVHFSGFIDREEYLRLRHSADIIIALTTRDMTMQSAGYEALADCTPLITSPTRVLMKFFGEAAVYSDPNRNAIVDAIKVVLALQPKYVEEMRNLRKRQLVRQVAAVDAIRARISALRARQYTPTAG